MGLFGDDDQDNFTVIDLQLYQKKDSLQYGKRRYNNVYEESTLTFIFADLFIQNRKYKEEDWEGTFLFKATNKKTGKKIISFEEKVTISKDLPTANVRSGYGNINTGFWKEGHYKMEAIFEKKTISETEFYVFNKGEVTANHNPYFKLYGFKLFLSPVETETDEQRYNRTYYKTFKEDELFYLGIEVLIDPVQPKGLYPTQLSVYINHIDGTQKAYWRSTPLTIEASKGNRMLSLHWGNSAGTFWKQGTYNVYIHFMDVLLGITQFTVADHSIEFKGENMLTEEVPKGGFTPKLNTSGVAAPAPNITFEEAKKELFELIGLTEVKEEIEELATFLQFIKIRKEKGIDDKTINGTNLIFTGNPGTGKTTVAKLLGKIYKSLGILSSGHLIEVGRAELIAQYIGQTAPKVKKVIEKARGGVLFIDEAYALARKGESEKDYGKEAVEVLMKEMSDGAGDLVIVFAGYPKEMEEFTNSNPGLKSRISQTIHFDDYTPKELFDIGLFAAKKKNVSLTPDAQVFLQDKLFEAYRTRDDDFGNARFVFSIIQEAKTNLAMRVMKEKNNKELNKEALSTISLPDLLPIFEQDNSTMVDIPIDNQLLEESLNELNNLIGLSEIKEDIFEVIKLVKYYRKIGRDFRKDFSLHIVFTGNPGTGKTTMARILVKIYKALGVLERGHLVEVDRNDLVASYTGQTAPKTDAVIDNSLGGMLFIDEAYSLVLHNDSFGNEAIETLLKRMEDDRGEFTVVAAGYTNEMKKFLESNPGLNSRFDRIWHFTDYTLEELVDIGELMFLNNELILSKEAKDIFSKKINNLISLEGKHFGNARSVRKMVDEIKKNQLLRMAENTNQTISTKEIETILPEDLDDLSATKIETKRGLGFKKDN